MEQDKPFSQQEVTEAFHKAARNRGVVGAGENYNPSVATQDLQAQMERALQK